MCEYYTFTLEKQTVNASLSVDIKSHSTFDHDDAFPGKTLFEVNGWTAYMKENILKL